MFLHKCFRRRRRNDPRQGGLHDDHPHLALEGANTHLIGMAPFRRGRAGSRSVSMQCLSVYGLRGGERGGDQVSFEETFKRNNLSVSLLGKLMSSESTRIDSARSHEFLRNISNNSTRQRVPRRPRRRCRSTSSIPHSDHQLEEQQAECLRSSSRGRAIRSVSCLSIAIREPSQPVHSLPGPPVPLRPPTSQLDQFKPKKPPRPSKAQADAKDNQNIEDKDPLALDSEEMKLRRSTSDGRVSSRTKKNGIRDSKSRSVHFDNEKDLDGKVHDELLDDDHGAGDVVSKKQNAKLANQSSGEMTSSKDEEDEDEADKKNGIQRQRNLFELVKAKVGFGRRRNKSNSNSNASKSPDMTSNGNEQEGGQVNGAEEDVNDDAALTDVPGMAPLAKPEDITDEAKVTGLDNSPTSDLTKEHNKSEKIAELRKHPYFRLDIIIGAGKNLLAMDRGGVSDPFVKCIQNQDKLFLTRVIGKTVNPVWGESFTNYIDNIYKPLIVQVFDKDVVGSDDFMGEAQVDLLSLDLKKPTDMKLELTHGNNEDLIRKNKKNKSLGTVSLRITVNPVTKAEMNAVLRAEKVNRSGKGKLLSWSAVVHVVLVQARSLIAMDAGETSDPYCRVSLGKEKFKSKCISKTINPKWREGFDLYWYEDENSQLEIEIFDKDIGSKDDFLGRVAINLFDLTPEVTHNLWRDIEDGEGQLNVLVTITGTTRGDSSTNIIHYDPDKLIQMQREWIEKYNMQNTFKNVKDVGHLMVKVWKAQGLQPADMGGKSDPFVVLELVNDRVQTQTEYKTLAPTWQKIFQFDVKDIHDCLEVIVYDEDKDHKYEFLGKVKIPLLKIKNNEQKWYMLKDKKLRKPAKGDNPQIMLEMFFVYNKVRASIRTINPKQMKYEDRSDIKFKHSVFMRNLNRVKAATAHMNPDIVLKEIKSILGWENKTKTSFCFVTFLLTVYYVEIWMVTLALMVPFAKNMIVMSVTGGWAPAEELDYDDEDDDDTKAGLGKDDEKRSLKERMQAVQEISLMIQNGLGTLAHVLESIGNVFNFSVPFLSLLAIFFLTVATLLTYLIPIRAIIIVWGINKFTKKILRPNSLDNNELVDFISRVPDNEERLDVRELPSPDNVAKKAATAAMKKRNPRDNDVI